MNTDITVVGAGPVGAFSAFQAAKMGARVTICEEHGKTGVPLHCTGHVSLAGLKRLGLSLPDNIFENQIRSAIFYSPSGYQFSVRFASPMTCVVARDRFDLYLLEMALKSGAKISYNTRVDSLMVDKRSVKGVLVKRKKKAEKLVSSVVIDAEGVSSNLLKRAGLPSPDRWMVVNAVQADVDKVYGMESDAVEVFLSNRFASGLFAWIVPRRGGTAKVGLGTAKGSAHECLRRFVRHNPVAHQRLRQSQMTNLVYHPISLGGPISRTFFDGLLVVGDAASHVKPTTGGGIIMGLTCAEIAGEVAANAVCYGNPSANFLSEYERRWRRRIGFNMMAMKRLRLMLNRLSDRQFDRLVSLCSRLRLDEDLTRVRDVDFQGTSLMRISKSPKVLATALYFLTASFL